MRYTNPRKALLAELSTDMIFVVVIMLLFLFHAMSPATGEADKGRAHHSAQEFFAPLLL